MSVDVSIPTTARQDALLARCLEYENAQRALRGEAPLADVNALARLQLIDELKALVQTLQADEGIRVQKAYLDAELDVQSQVKTLLGVS